MAKLCLPFLFLKTIISKMKANKIIISIIIPAFNEEKVIERLLKSIKKQTYKKFEIIVVDDGSIDKTIIVARQFTKKVYKRTHAERSVQRNFGAKKAKGKYLFFLDADMELLPKVLSECIDKVSNKQVGVVIVPEESVSTNYWERVKAFERSFYNISGSTTDAGRFVRREAFKEVGGYDETITGPEDWDLAESIIKLGFKSARIRSKIFHYERVPSLYSLGRKKYYYGLKSHRYLKKQQISALSPKTIYFLRPDFYRNWKKLIHYPNLSVGMLIMLTVELISGGTGYLIGLITKK
jgi:glycosyltransferase involved in cell wall biosynthesis